MPARTTLLIALIALSGQLYAQGMSSFLPAKSAPKAARLLSVVDSASSDIDARRGASRRAQAQAESEMIEAYALAAASRTSKEAWASPDGARKAADAPVAFTVARAKAKTAALALATGGKAESSREEASAALASLILSSGIGEKSANALARSLTEMTRERTGLFPESSEIAAALRKSGAAGAREAAAVAARREPDEVAAALLASKARLISLSPASAGAFDRLESAFGAYRSWMAASPLAAYPGDLGSAKDEERSVLAAGMRALASLGEARTEALLEAMSARGGRDAAAAEAARRLAETWARSPAPARRSLAALCGLRESILSTFASLAGESPHRAAALRPSGGGAARESSDSKPRDQLEIMGALGGLEIAIADEEGSGDRPGSDARGAEPALLLLERPELASAAKLEERYSSLYEEATRRIAALYTQAAVGAEARLESSSAVVKSAAAALGSSPTGLVIRAIDLSLSPGENGRKIAFFATATDSAGATVLFPLSAEIAASEYATAFARAAGLTGIKSDPSRADGAALLSKYGQLVVTAYDPEGSGDSYAVGAYPSLGGITFLDEVDIELSLLGGWQP